MSEHQEIHTYNKEYHLPHQLKERVFTMYYKNKFSYEVLNQLKEYYHSDIPYLDMGYVARYCSDIGSTLYGNRLYQYVQNYLDFLYGYKDFTEEYPEIIKSIKSTFTRSCGIPVFTYYELMDDYRYPGVHSGGSFAVCISALHRLIKINTGNISKKEKIQSWKKFCIVNRLY